MERKDATFTNRCLIRDPGGGQFIQILNVRQLAGGRRVFLELVPRLAWQHCEVWYFLLMKRLRNNQTLGPRTANIVGQMTDKATALCMSWNRGFPHHASACRTVRNKSQQDPTDPLPPRGACHRGRLHVAPHTPGNDLTLSHQGHSGTWGSEIKLTRKGCQPGGSRCQGPGLHAVWLAEVSITSVLGHTRCSRLPGPGHPWSPWGPWGRPNTQYV